MRFISIHFSNRAAHMNFRQHVVTFSFAKSVLLAVALVTIFAVLACGGSSEPLASEGATVDEEGVRLVTRPEASYTIDDLAAVGFKKNRQFGAETVPGANDIWYGFFSQRDIEVRFYDTHADAVALGTEPAEVIIARTAGQRDALIPVVNLYPAYAIVGNTVMLCEREISTCEALIAALP
jgi:hypothetical protein